MFTGLVQAVGRVERAEAMGAGRRLVVRAEGWDHRPVAGESIAVNGCCLTVAGLEGGAMAFDAIPETLGKTTVGEWEVGRRVNLERSLRVSDLMGGHVVQGHVDGIGLVERVSRTGEHRVTVRPRRELMEFLAPKGSVAMDGVSLTVASLDLAGGAFEVTLIPVTLAATTLADLDAGARVNLEMDAMAKQIVHYLKHFAGRD
jgi:riboflavin synthase